MAPDYFMLFSKLPAELRLAVWECYALPFGPMVHTFNLKNYHNLGTMWITSRSIGVLVHPLETPMGRVLMQVSHEARTVMLQGREPRFWHNEVYGTSRSCYGPPYRKLLFVDWVKDVFYLKFRTTLSGVSPAVERYLQQMRHIAVALQAQDYRYGVGLFNAWEPHFAAFGRAGMGSLLPLVERLTLILLERDTYRLFSLHDDYSQLQDGHKDDDKQSLLSRYAMFLKELQREADHNGLYLTGPNDQRFSDLRIFCQDSQTSYEISFSAWAASIIARARDEMLERFGKAVDVEIKISCNDLSRFPCRWRDRLLKALS
ncbi:hypothetical protein F5Y18DRAFT_423298 [Xylariaceae sp. FL1019]|nr:hypothetical protein F5Y18DRAFT_423298 [Xylariaceae sp. FL1019]